MRERQREVAELAAAVLHHDPRRQLGRTRERLSSRTARLDRSAERSLRTADARLDALDARLHSLSPLAVLERGYALVRSSDGRVIRSIAQVAGGDHVTTRLSDGEFSSVVETPDRKKTQQEVRL